MKRVVCGSLLGLLILWSGLSATQAQPVAVDGKSGTPAAAAPAPSHAQQVPAGVAEIVFVDKEKPCPCTDERTKASWKVLQNALKDRKDVRVTRIHYDTESAKAERYTRLKPLMVIPGLYFMNGQGKVLAMLQGEVKLAQITAVFKKNGPTG